MDVPNDPNPIPGTYKWEHGTLCSGWANATTNNNIGVASIAWNLKTMPVQAGWDAFIFQAYNAIIYAGENGADIISCSWGNFGFTSVAALNSHDELSSYSNFGPQITISAPGGDFGDLWILTTDLNNTYTGSVGTSCATPITAGLLHDT